MLLCVARLPKVRVKAPGGREQGLQRGAEGVGLHELAGSLRQLGVRQVGLRLLQCLQRPSPHAALSAWSDHLTTT